MVDYRIESDPPAMVEMSADRILRDGAAEGLRRARQGRETAGALHRDQPPGKRGRSVLRPAIRTSSPQRTTRSASSSSKKSTNSSNGGGPLRGRGRRAAERSRQEQLPDDTGALFRRVHHSDRPRLRFHQWLSRRGELDGDHRGHARSHAAAGGGMGGFFQLRRRLYCSARVWRRPSSRASMSSTSP